MIRRKNSLRKELVGMTLAAIAALALSASSALALQSGRNNPFYGTGTDPEFGEALIGYIAAPGGNTATQTNVTDPQEDNGLSSGDSDVTCAMFYVFDAHQLMQECCGCPVTSDGLRTVNNVTDLGSAAVFGPFPLTSGVVRIISAEPNGCDSLSSLLQVECESGGPLADVCDATGGVFPSGQYRGFNPAYAGNHQFVGSGDSSLNLVDNLRAWGTHIQNGALTESEYAHNVITQNDANSLAEACGDITQNGSTGVCSCGVGDANLLFP